MSTIAQRIAQKRAERQRSFTDVDAWGEDDTPLRIYFSPVSARDIEKLQRKHKTFLSDPTLGSMVDLIIEKSENESGDKVFTLEDRPILLGESVEVIAGTFGAIFNASSVEDHEKN